MNTTHVRTSTPRATRPSRTTHPRVGAPRPAAPTGAANVLVSRAATAIAVGYLTALHRLTGPDPERGEGVISAAIAVLIMAFLGAAMWVAFKEIFANASDRTSTSVDTIGR